LRHRHQRGRDHAGGTADQYKNLYAAIMLSYSLGKQVMVYVDTTAAPALLYFHRLGGRLLKSVQLTRGARTIPILSEST